VSRHSTQQSRSVTQSLLAALAFAGLAVLGFAAAWLAFVWYPADLADVLGVGAVVVAMVPVLWIGRTVAGSIATSYSVAEVGVEGPIARDRGGGPLPNRPASVAADDVVQQIDRADADPSVRALLVKLNTPGGEIVPSEDIRIAVERFDGPTVAYATDRCASGGYDIASGCDVVFAREGSLVF
jgi:protease-4